MTNFNVAYKQIPRVQVEFDPDTAIVENCHAESCDINVIINRFHKTGVLQHRNTHRGEYGFASSQTFQDAMLIVAQGNSMFSELPSDLRDRFDQDPSKFLAFVQDEKNASELVELGLATELNDIASKTPQITRKEIIDALATATPSNDSKESSTSSES